MVQPTVSNEQKPFAATQEQRDHFDNHLRALGLYPLTCPLCKNIHKWHVSRNAILMRGVTGSLHIAAFDCGNCGNILLFHHSVLGPTDTEDEQIQAEPSAGTADPSSDAPDPAGLP
jgi:hypothetical protein